MKSVAKPNHRRHGRDRNEAGWDNFAANERIQQGRFAALELTDTCDIEAPFGNPGCEFAGFLGDRLSSEFLCQIRKPQQSGSAIRGHGCLSWKVPVILYC